MEGSQSNKDGSKFGSFVDKIPCAPLASAGDMGLHYLNATSEAGRDSLKLRRQLGSSQFGMHEPLMIGNNRCDVGFPHTDVLPEQWLASAFGDMTLRDHTADSPTDPSNVVPMKGNFPSGSVKSYSGLMPVGVTLNQPFIPAIVKDDRMHVQFSAEHVNQKTNQLTFDQQEAHRFPLHNGNFPRRSWMHTMNTICSDPCNLLAPSASHTQQQFYIDGQSQTYAPCDHQFSSNFMWQNDMDAQTYPVMQTSRKSAFVNSLSSRLYANNSCGNDDLRQRAEKFSNPYEPNSLSIGYMQHQISDNISTLNCSEKILRRSGGVNAVSNTKFAPSMNLSTGMDQRIDSYEHNHLDIQSNDSLRLDGLNSQFLSFVTESWGINYDSANKVAGRIYILAKDQNGCRFLQKVFAEGTQEDVEKVFGAIIDHICELMMDPFGNYLVQKLLEGCSHDQWVRIICEVTKVPGELIAVSCNMHGTRAVQKIVETINTADQVAKVVSALSPGAMRLMLDVNGSHVANRCLQKLLPESNAFLFDAAMLHYLELATDRQGCCILQKCIEHSNDEQKFNLLSNITSSALRLSDDQYGNYVIQSIINHNILWATDKIVDELVGHFGYLSMQKCGSHVVENCLNRAPQHKCDIIIDELMNDPRLRHIMLDQYGNFVIQTALAHCKGALHTAFVEAIRPHAPALQSNMYGKRVLSKTYLKNKQYRVGIS